MVGFLFLAPRACRAGFLLEEGEGLDLILAKLKLFFSLLNIRFLLGFEEMSFLNVFSAPFFFS